MPAILAQAVRDARWLVGKRPLPGAGLEPRAGLTKDRRRG